MFILLIRRLSGVCFSSECLFAMAIKLLKPLMTPGACSRQLQEPQRAVGGPIWTHLGTRTASRASGPQESGGSEIYALVSESLWWSSLVVSLCPSSPDWTWCDSRTEGTRSIDHLHRPILPSCYDVDGAHLSSTAFPSLKGQRDPTCVFHPSSLDRYIFRTHHSAPCNKCHQQHACQESVELP